MSEAAASSPADSGAQRSLEFGFVSLDHSQLQPVSRVAESRGFDFRSGLINLDGPSIAPIDQPNPLSITGGEVT